MVRPAGCSHPGAMQHHTYGPVIRTTAALAAAMGVGRFAYTPILPLMTAQAGLGPHAAGHLATANYAGYLAGAVAAALSPRIARSRSVFRSCLVAVTLSLLCMPLTTAVPGWLGLRAVAGGASALAFVIAVNALLDSAPHHAGWGFGGVGIGIALSAALVLALPAGTDWRVAWWTTGAAAAALSALAWRLPARTVAPKAATTAPARAGRGQFGLLLAGYTLEGVGYIVAGTFLVAAVAQSSPGRLGGAAWLVVGLAVIPSAAVWDRLSERYARPALLTVALLLQAGGIALACTGSGAAALVGAILFGGTFIGVSSLALAEGRVLRIPAAVALLTADYSAGQIIGPLLVTPLLHNGFHHALMAGAAVVSLAALVCAAMWVIGRQPRAGVPDTQIADIAGEGLDDGEHRRPVLIPPPHQ